MKNKHQLSKRELEVLEKRCKGFLVKQVAGELNIKPRTAETHLAKCYKKLGILPSLIHLFITAVIEGYYQCPKLESYYKNKFSKDWE